MAATPTAAAPAKVTALISPTTVPAAAEVDGGAPDRASGPISVRVTTRPAGARLLVDGRPAANPLDLRLPRLDGGWLVLSAAAPGFVTQVVRHPRDRDLDLELTLDREPRPASRAAAGTGGGRLRLRNAEE
jgi:hypothetical protein